MKSDSKKVLWKVAYGVMVVGCLVCIGVMAMFLVKDKQQEEAAEVQQQELEEHFVTEVATEVPVEETVEEPLAELPVDFEGLWEINPEIYAWIEVPDTKINYPVLQHEGEDQGYYLSRDIHGKSNQAGSIYTEDYNNKDFKDPHTILYGHNMKNGSMFHNVRYFAEKEFFEEHKDLFIYLPDRILKYEIIACYEYDDRHLLGSFDFDDEEAYGKYLEEIMNPRSMYTMIRKDREITVEDHLITLSTCVANKPNNRRLLQAVLIEETPAEYRGAGNEETVD
jgi:sortase B